MFRKSLKFILVIALSACTGVLTPVPTPSTDQMNGEQQAVYAALLQKLYSATSYVIMDATDAGPTGIGEMSNLEYIKQNMPDVGSDTLKSFQARNDAEYPIQPDMNIGSNYVLMTKEERSQIFSQNQDGWQIFYDHHPDAPGITSLSQVGFNSAFDQALVYVGTMSHWLSGAGYYVLLIKVNGTWVVDKQLMTWIS